MFLKHFYLAFYEWRIGNNVDRIDLLKWTIKTLFFFSSRFGIFAHALEVIADVQIANEFEM